MRLVLNKADDVESDKLLRVYGSLLWSLGKVFPRTSEIPRVYVGSFGPKTSSGEAAKPEAPSDSDGDAAPDDAAAAAAAAAPPAGNSNHARAKLNSVLFKRDQADLLEEILELPHSSTGQRINDMVKRIRGVRVHMCVQSHLYGQMPSWRRRAKAKKAELLATLPAVFAAVSQKYVASTLLLVLLPLLLLLRPRAAAAPAAPTMPAPPSLLLLLLTNSPPPLSSQVRSPHGRLP